MASNYTEHYGLSLWEPGDAFVRTEFNADHEKVDAGLREARRAAEQAREGMAAVDYNVYNLLLQSYYAGKSTAWKRAVVFDGFRDGGQIAAKDEALTLGGGALVLSRSGQGDVSMGWSGASGTELEASTVRTAVGGGRLTGVTFRVQNSYSNARAAGVSCTVYVGDSAVREESFTFSTVAVGQTGSFTLTLSGSVELKAGDRFSVRLGAAENWRFALSSDGGLGGTIHITPTGGTSGTVTSTAYGLPACGEVLAWVRHGGGNVSLSVGGRALELLEQRQTADAQGAACLEESFRLSGGLPEGEWPVKVTLELKSGEQSAKLLDYGLILK